MAERKMRRLGGFSIPRSFIDDEPVAVKQCLNNVIVVDAKLDFHSDCIKYIGICSAFEPIEEGMHYLHYDAIFHRIGDGAVFVRFQA